MALLFMPDWFSSGKTLAAKLLALAWQKQSRTLKSPASQLEITCIGCVSNLYSDFEADFAKQSGRKWSARLGLCYFGV